METENTNSTVKGLQYCYAYCVLLSSRGLPNNMCPSRFCQCRGRISHFVADTIGDKINLLCFVYAVRGKENNESINVFRKIKIRKNLEFKNDFINEKKTYHYIIIIF